MPTLHIFLAGSPAFAHDDAAPCSPVQHVRTLLAFLASQGPREFPRELIAGTLWADTSDREARRCLSTALWRLRLMLEPDGIRRGTFLRAQLAGDVGLNWSSDVRLDINHFGAAISRLEGTGTPDLEELRAIAHSLDGYTDNVLDGLYDEWALRVRESLRHAFIRAQLKLTRSFATFGAIEEAIASARRVLDLDPLREDVHRAVMEMLHASGQTGAALRQFRTCAMLLERELGVGPSRETELLHHALRTEAPDTVSRPEPSAGQLPACTALSLINAATANLQQAARLLSPK